jgi:hypothetical protein
MTWQDAARAASILQIMARLIQDGGLEERVQALEAKLAGIRTPVPNGHDRPEARA